MYLYVDVISYYYKNNLNLDDKDSSDCSYYYKINNNNKNGYVKITKDKDKYFMKVVYNYAKIETYVEEYELADILSYSMIILNSINYNDNLIEKILQDDYYSSSFKEYKIKKPEDAESKFSEYLSEYVGEEDSIIPDLPEYQKRSDYMGFLDKIKDLFSDEEEVVETKEIEVEEKYQKTVNAIKGLE